MFNVIDMLCINIYCHIHVYGLPDFEENEEVWKRDDIYQLCLQNSLTEITWQLIFLLLYIIMFGLGFNGNNSLVSGT